MRQELTISAPVATAIATYTGTLISENTFSELSDIINKIANNKDELTDGMRQAATSYANDWDKLVVDRLDNRVEQIKVLQDFFDLRRPDYHTISCYCAESRYHGRSCEIMSAVINMLRSGTDTKWHTFADQLSDIVDSVEELKANGDTAPVREDYFEVSERDMGYDDRIIAQKKWELDVAKHQKQLFKQQMKIRVQFVKVLSAMVKDPDIQELLKGLKEQKRKAVKAQSLVHEKSALVKLAINFGGTQLLSALQELHDFQQKL